MKTIFIRYLSGPDVARVALDNDEILDALETGLRAQGDGATVIEPRMHLEPDPSFHGHFNVLRGYIAPRNTAGIKIVGDYHDNYTRVLPSEFGLLNLLDADTGQPRAVLDAIGITEMRTGAVSARYLAPKKPQILGHR